MQSATEKQIPKKPALSISAIDMLSKCGEQYRRRYIEKERLPPGIALLVGKAVDGAVNANLQYKMVAHELLPLEQVRSVARDTFAFAWSTEEVHLTDEERKQGTGKSKGEAIDKTVRLAELHAEKVAPQLQPTAVQRKWTLELPRYPMDLTGYTDIEEGATVRDTKTSHKSPRADEAELSDQLTLYALAKRVLDKQEDVIPVALDYLVDLKTPKVEVRTSTRSLEDFQIMLRRIEVAQAAIEKGAFVPARQSDWWCSEKWCGYSRTCPYFRRPVSIAVPESLIEGE